MERINSQTRSTILLEALYYLDKFENERISLYKSLETANRIKIDFDFDSKFIYISAILPIDSVDMSKPITDPNRVVFPDWNEEINVVSALSYVLVPGYTISVDVQYDDDTSATEITIVYVPPYLAPIGVSELVYSSALTIQKADEARPMPRKNIQITFDQPNLKAIVEAILPFESHRSNSGAIVVTPLDE
jgi:hypothetical protein